MLQEGVSSKICAKGEGTVHRKALGEQPGCHRGFRFYSNPTSGQFYNSEALDVGASHAFPILRARGAVGSSRQNTHPGL